MLAYAANRSLGGNRQSSPNALLLIIGGHVALIAAVMSAKMDLPRRMPPDHQLIQFLPEPPPPPPHAINQAHGAKSHRPQLSVDRGPSIVPFKQPNNSPDDGLVVNTGTRTGATALVTPIVPPTSISPIHHDPQLLTRPDDLKPPYPPAKILSEEEAVLTLRLSIDEHGRVVAVEPVGKADRDFFDAARRHLLARWRYQPAMDDGRAVASSLVITLRFRLDG